AGYYVGAALYRLGLSPTGISYCGAVLVILTFLVALALPSIVLVTLLLLLVGTLDCADGALARYLGRGSPRGELADAIGGYVILAVLPYITWVMLFPGDARYSAASMAVAAVTGFFVTLHFIGRSAYLKKRTAEFEETTLQEADDTAATGWSKSGSQTGKLVKMLSSNLGFCGFMFPALFVFWLLGGAVLGWLYLVGYSAFAGGVSTFIALRATVAK